MLRRLKGWGEAVRAQRGGGRGVGGPQPVAELDDDDEAAGRFTEGARQMLQQ